MLLGEINGDEVTLYQPTAFLRDWARSRYQDSLTLAWQAEDPSVRRVDIRIAPKNDRKTADREADPSAFSSLRARKETFFKEALPPDAIFSETGSPESRLRERHSEEAAVRQISAAAAGLSPAESGRCLNQNFQEASSFPDERFSFENFVVGKPNEFAYACARHVVEHKVSREFNPLFFHGGVGLGKTHLMRAIAREISLKNPGKVVTYMTSEKFFSDFMDALRAKTTLDFKRRLRSSDVLMIDDLQFLISKETTQEEFFQTFNAIIDAGKQIVISADKSPSELTDLADRLRTRLGGGMVAALETTTYELRLLIIQAKSEAVGMRLHPKIQSLLAQKITSNIRELEGALYRLDFYAKTARVQLNTPESIDTVQDILRDLLSSHDRRISIEEIQQQVAGYYNIRLTELSSARRSRTIARPRQVAMYLAKQMTSLSLPAIGQKFGNRDHTTVLHAVNRITELIEKDPAVAEGIRNIRKNLEA